MDKKKNSDWPNEFPPFDQVRNVKYSSGDKYLIVLDDSLYINNQLLINTKVISVCNGGAHKFMWTENERLKYTK